MRLPLTGVDAEQLADTIEAAAMRDLYQVAPPTLGARTTYIGGATALIAPKLPVTYFNRVIGLGSAAPTRDSDIDDIIAAYAVSKVGSYWIHVGPAARPPSLSNTLTERRFTLATQPSWAKFLRSVEPPSPHETPLIIREATTADADAVGTVVCTAFGLPSEISPWFGALIGRSGWHVWVAERNKQIVATGSLFVQGKTGWQGVGATLPPYRGLGAQNGLIKARIRAAAELGCRVLATETGEPTGNESNPSLSNIRRAGFTQVSSRLNYASPEAAAPAFDETVKDPKRMSSPELRQRVLSKKGV